jgi:glycosidase
MAHLINDRSFWDEAIPELRRRHADRELLFLAECYGTANNLDLFARGINAAYDDDFYKLWLYAYGVGADGATRLRLSPQAEHNADFRDKLDAFRAGGLAAAAARALQNYERGAPGKGPWLARYTDNHDEGRGLYRFGAGGTRAAMRLAFLSGHCLPFLLAGQEFGALNRPPIHERIGPCDKGRRRLDDRGEREEAGVEFEGNLFARGRDERQAWRAFYRELIQLRRARRELREGAFATLDAGEEAAPAERTVLAFERRLGRRALRCAVNLGPEPRRLARADRFAGRWLYGRLDQDRLGAFEAVVAIPAEGR